MLVGLTFVKYNVPSPFGHSSAPHNAFDSVLKFKEKSLLLHTLVSIVMHVLER